MVIENITRIRFTSRRTPEQQRHLTISDSLFGQIIINNQRMSFTISEIFRHRTSGIRRDILQCCRIAGARGNHSGIGHGTVFFQNGDNLSHSGLLLAAGNINAENILTFLAKDGINGDSCFADLAVTNDQLPLPSTHRCHGVNCLQAGDHGFMNTFSGNNTRSNHFNASEFLGVNGSLSVQRLTNSRNHAAKNRLADRHLRNTAGSLDNIPFLDMNIGSHDGDTHVVFLKVQDQSENTTREFHQFKGHCFLKAIDSGNTIANRQNDPCFTELDLFVVILDLILNDLTNFFSF